MNSKCWLRVCILIQIRQKVVLIFVPIRITRNDKQMRISLKQSLKNFEYLWSVFISLSVFCSSYPYINKTIKRGKLFYSTEFMTRQLKSLNEIYNIFYLVPSTGTFPFEKAIGVSKIKSITPDLFHYLEKYYS